MINVNNEPIRPEKLSKEDITKLINITNDIIDKEVKLNIQLGLIHKDTKIEVICDSSNGVMLKITLDEPVDNIKQVIEVHKGIICPCFTDSYTKTLKVIKTPRIVSMLSLFSFHVNGEHLDNEVLYGDKQTLIENDLKFLLEK